MVWRRNLASNSESDSCWEDISLKEGAAWPGRTCKVYKVARLEMLQGWQCFKPSSIRHSVLTEMVHQVTCRVAPLKAEAPRVAKTRNIIVSPLKLIKLIHKTYPVESSHMRIFCVQ